MKRALLSLLVIVAVAAVGGMGTYADLSDYEVSPGNYFATGNCDLQLGDNLVWPSIPPSRPIDPDFPEASEGGPLNWPDENYGQDPSGVDVGGDSVFATWDRTPGYPDGMQPGDVLIGQVKLWNAGTTDASRLDISCANVNYNEFDNPTSDKDKIMIIHAMAYRVNGVTYNLLSKLKSLTGKDTVTLDDLEHHPLTNLKPPLIAKDGVPAREGRLSMTVVFGPDPLGTYQLHKTHFTMRFDLFE